MAGGSAADKQAFKEIYDTWVNGYLNGDLAGLSAILADDVILMPAGQDTVRGKAAAIEYFKPRIGRPGVKFIDDIQEVVINGSWGYVYGNFTLQIPPKSDEGSPYHHHGRYFVLYQKQDDGTWKVYRDIDNVRPAETQ